MKPPKFHVGQAVIALDGEWDNALCLTEPQENRIYTVLENYYCKHQNEWYIELSELRGARWDQDGFAPVELLSNEALAELLSETLEPVTA